MRSYAVLPGQVAEFEYWCLRAFGCGEDAFDAVEVVEYEIVDEELAFGPNV